MAEQRILRAARRTLVHRRTAPFPFSVARTNLVDAAMHILADTRASDYRSRSCRMRRAALPALLDCWRDSWFYV